MTTDADKTQEVMTLEMKAIIGKEVASSYDLKLFSERNEDYMQPGKVNVIYWVGEQEDHSTGIFGGAVSPTCRTADEAWAWCVDNREFLDGMFGDHEGGLTL